MRIANNLAESIGKTPLIRLNKASEETGCEILGKAEFMNPGQSVKDRAALFIIALLLMIVLRCSLSRVRLPAGR